MRLRGRAVAGFYPAPEEAVALAAEFLTPPAKRPWSLLDPCAGQGAAVQQLANLLHCPPSMVYAVELASDRAEALAEALPEGKVLAPCSFMSVFANLNSFSLAWVNPPFDSGDGERCEMSFLRRATELLCADGVMMLVTPEDQVEAVGSMYADIPRFFREWYRDVQVVPFPEGHRPFNEVVVFGVKREKSVDPHQFTWERIQAKPGTTYRIPSGTGPRAWKKTEPTEEELCQALAESTLRTRAQTSDYAKVPSPPLALGVGHVALLLASGQLDGVVEANGHSHVVRGTARKRQYVASCVTTENENRTETTKTVLREKISLVVRTVDLAGNITTFRDSPEEDAVLAPAEEEE